MSDTVAARTNGHVTVEGAIDRIADPRDAIRDRPTRWLVGGLVAGFLLGWRS